MRLRHRSLGEFSLSRHYPFLTRSSYAFLFAVIIQINMGQKWDIKRPADFDESTSLVLYIIDTFSAHLPAPLLSVFSEIPAEGFQRDEGTA